MADRPPPPRPRSRRWRLARRPAALAGLVIVAGALVVGVAGDALAPHGANQLTNDRDQAPSLAHPMGTDAIGRDLLAQVLAGLQTSVRVALVVAAASTALGAAVGAAAAWRGGALDALLGRLTDLALTIPLLPVLLVLAHRLGREGGSWLLLGLLIGAVAWPATARVVRAACLPAVGADYVQAARAAGAAGGRVVVRHLLPNAAGAVVTAFTLAFAFGVLAEATLAFLGFDAGGPSLGALVDAGRGASRTRPWLFYFPGAVLVVLTVGVSLLGDAVRDALDPAGSAAADAVAARPAPGP